MGPRLTSYALDHLSKARVWWDEDPFDGSTRSKCLVVELWIPRGPRAEYALLGASLDHDNTNVRVSCPEDAGRWEASLAEGFDDVRIGLPTEYRESVSREARLSIGGAVARVGIVFDRAAHGAVGSSPALFGRLAAAIVGVLPRREDFATEPPMREILQDACDS